MWILQNVSLFSRCWAEAYNEFAGPISASLCLGNTAPFKEMSQRLRAVGNTVSDLNSSRLEPKTSRSRGESVTVRPTIDIVRFHLLSKLLRHEIRQFSVKRKFGSLAFCVRQQVDSKMSISLLTCTVHFFSKQNERACF